MSYGVNDCQHYLATRKSRNSMSQMDINFTGIEEANQEIFKQTAR